MDAMKDRRAKEERLIRWWYLAWVRTATLVLVIVMIAFPIHHLSLVYASAAAADA